jgi:signal transduction histidine kinase
MRLPEFIRTRREQILAEWETFARTCAPASATMDVAALRDHASEMLSVIAADLMNPQSTLEQSEKSQGRAPDAASSAPTAAEKHGVGRAESGFTVEQMVAEYRALRASVLRLWTKEQGSLVAEDIDELTRFNEAIDQALAESVSEFNENVDSAKEMFLGILGHDLRTPLGAIYSSATFMLEEGQLGDAHRTLAQRIARGATRTMAMVGDLLDFTRSRLGGGIPVTRVEIDLAKVVRDAADEVSAAHPDSEIRVEAEREERGAWDAARVSQALINLIVNAVEHGSAGEPVTVALRGDEDEVSIAVRNRGVIAGERLDGIFNPLKGSTTPRTSSSSASTGNLGLGLYIAERIVVAHCGRIGVASSEAEGTTFTVHLPRNV